MLRGLDMFKFDQSLDLKHPMPQDPIALSFSKTCDLSNIKCLSIGSGDFSVGFKFDQSLYLKHPIGEDLLYSNTFCFLT